MSKQTETSAQGESIVRLRREALDWLPVDDEVVVLDGERDLYLGTNTSGSVLWEALSAGATRTQLVDLLLDHYEVHRERAANDVAAFLAQLASDGLLEDT